MDDSVLPSIPAEPAVTAADLAASWAAVREHGPLVQCLTNIVAAPLTANVLLAAGAAPAMVDNAHEARGFAAAASGVLVNLGTPYDDTTAAMREAVAGAGDAGTPWVLDPVAVGGLPWRTAVARELLALAAPGAGGRGADSVDSPADALVVARRLAREHGCVVAISGEVDHLTDGERVLRLANGHAWMTKVTGVGCALGALVAACAAVTDDALTAAGAATAALTVAAERAAAVTEGPGTFAARLLDELSTLHPDRLAAQVALS